MTSYTIQFWTDDTTITEETLAQQLGTAAHNVQVLTDEALGKLADDIKRKEYWETVRAIVADAADQVKAGDIDDTEALDEWLHETIDGHHDVIYTYAAQQVLLYSDNDGAYTDDFGAEGMVKDGAINWSALAYCALLADVRETIGDADDFMEEHQPAVPEETE